MKSPRPPDPPPGRARQGGFTLLETLVALVLLSLISVVVVESYRAGLAMWERQHRETSTLDTARAVLERMRSQIKSAHPWSFRDQGKFKLYVKGSGDSLDFTSLVGLTSRRPGGVLHAVRYRLVESPEGKRLRLEEYSWPRRGFPEGEDPLVGEDVPGVADLKLSYHIEETTTETARDAAGKVTRTTQRRWTETWPGEEQPKKGETLVAVSVSITVEVEQGEPEEYTAVIPVMRSPPASEGR